uniref:PPFIA binding protein 1 n=1 Tax=Naja naja TaxID=35670 RepID=A0A8C6Y150_NAJNA
MKHLQENHQPQRELLSRTSLETQKLDLMAEVSNLKLKLTTVEKDRMDYEDRFGDDLMQEVNDLRLKVGEMDRERLQYEKKLKSTKVSPCYRYRNSSCFLKKMHLYEVNHNRLGIAICYIPLNPLIPPFFKFGFFLRLRRSQSTTFNPDDMSETEFKRGGTRATAGPRLGWSRDLGQSNNDLDMPFAKWRKEQVCSWLQDQGLGFYIGSGKHWILSGQTLLQASQSDLEKELGIKHPLHRKKLQLALQALGSEEENNYGKLDYNWVTRWLDDIGLPQYKTQFDDGKVDGRMLHYMTIDDLLSLKVLSVLHHLSIKRAIQVLRMNNFEPNCLLMEWLRSVDLAEYAPNLRGSGVHGGLMVLEPRFNVETLAQLLNIPPNKTLLRRHLATHFNLLVGSEAQQEKRSHGRLPALTSLLDFFSFQPKKLAFSNFGNLRKKKQDDGGEEYVCPMDLGQLAGTVSKKGFKPGLDNRVYDDDDLDRLEQVFQVKTERFVACLSLSVCLTYFFFFYTFFFNIYKY